MYASCLKRIIDVAAGAVLLVLLMPLMAATWWAVRIGLGSPVLFAQRRPGRNGQSFTILKFRSLLPETNEAGVELSESERVTRLGLLLRGLSLDELPQLINIVRGEMSFVGPRPLLERYLPFYTERERLRHSVRPGLTGWAQVRGRNDLAWDERLELDAWYAEHVSWHLDLRILLESVRSVLMREGVREDPGTVMAALDEQRRGDSRKIA